MIYTTSGGVARIGSCHTQTSMLPLDVVDICMAEMVHISSVCTQLLNLQTEEGPSPAAPEHIQDLPTVSIQQDTVGEWAVTRRHLAQRIPPLRHGVVTDEQQVRWP